jgi:hypothetical protein
MSRNQGTVKRSEIHSPWISGVGYFEVAKSLQLPHAIILPSGAIEK